MKISVKMKPMRVYLFATFRLIAGIKSFDIPVTENSTVIAAVREIVRRYPVLKKHWLNADDELHAHVHVFINEDEVTTLPLQFETQLKESDEVSFFPPVAGG